MARELLIFLLLPPVFCVGQTADSLFLTEARANAVARYTYQIAEQIPLVNGSEYKEYNSNPNLTTGHAYFVIDDWADGAVFYDSTLYPNVPLLFDEVTEKLVVEQPFSHFKLELISEKIKYFKLSGHTFVRLVNDKTEGSPATGFYDLMYDGATQTFVRRVKAIKETPQLGGVQVEFLVRDSYAIKKGGVYYPVKSRKSVMNLFADKKKTLRKKMRAHASEISFRQHRDTTIALVARLYDESQP